jgi:plastocyanin
MRKTLIAAIAATMLLGCGKDSTGPDTVNPNPDPQHYTITVNGDVFTPDTTNALIGDVIYWEVASGDAGQHQITFTHVPTGVPTPSPTKTLTAGQRDSTIFLKPGTYEYEDLIDQGGGAKGSGVVTISPLP